MNKSILILIIFTVGFFKVSLSQEGPIVTEDVITLEQAIVIALEKNHNIKIANNTVEINSNNATIGNAGLLPNITASGSYSGSVTDTEFKLFGQPSNTVNGAGSNTTSGSISASYLLFDGFGNYYRFQSLKSLEEQSGIQARLQIEATLLEVISLFLSAVTQKQNLEITNEAISRSVDRFNRISKRFELGNATRLDLLSAEVDLNADSVAFIQAQTLLENAKRDLLVQLGEEPDQTINLFDDVPLNYELLIDDIMLYSMENNASVVLSKLTADNALLNLKQNRSGRFPRINLTGSYDYFKNESDAGQLEFQESTGFSGGISISLNLFNGFQQETRIQNAQVQLKNSEESLSLAQKTLKRDVLNIYQNYETNLFLLGKEELNLKTAELSFERSKQLFELGQITNTQFRESQLNVSRVQQNILRLRVQAKLSEVSLYQLSGQLIDLEK
ncbi:MAG: TolC family protein [Balneolaceae bacterium]